MSYKIEFDFKCLDFLSLFKTKTRKSELQQLVSISMRVVIFLVLLFLAAIAASSDDSS